MYQLRATLQQSPRQGYGRREKSRTGQFFHLKFLEIDRSLNKYFFELALMAIGQALNAGIQALQPGSGTGHKTQPTRAVGHGLGRATQNLQQHLVWTQSLRLRLLLLE